MLFFEKLSLNSGDGADNNFDILLIPMGLIWLKFHAVDNASDTYHAQFADASLSDLAIDNDDSHQCPQSQSDFFSWDQ